MGKKVNFGLIARHVVLKACLLAAALLLPVSLFPQARDTVPRQDYYNPPFLFQGGNIPSPHKAAIYSAVLPGLGQIYNQQIWKVPILYAGIGGIVYAIHFNTKYYNLYRTAYRDFIIRDPGNTSYTWILDRTRLTREDVYGPYAEWFQRALDNRRRFYRRNRDLSYLGMAALYIANIIDATVDAHFFEFDVSDDLSLRIEPVLSQPFSGYERTGGFKLELKF